MPQEVRDQADALAEAGEDVSVKTIKQLKAGYESERQARELFERRAQESQSESNERRKTIRELETQIGLLKSQPVPEPQVVEKAPDDYEEFKCKAVEFQQQTDALQQQLATLQKQQARLVNDQVKAKLQEREYRATSPPARAQRSRLNARPG